MMTMRGLKASSMYKEFVGYLRKMEIGEFRISLENQGGIERKI